MRNTFFLTNSNSITRVDLQLCELKRRDTQFTCARIKTLRQLFKVVIISHLYPDQRSIFM